MKREKIDSARKKRKKKKRKLLSNSQLKLSYSSIFALNLHKLHNIISKNLMMFQNQLR